MRFTLLLAVLLIAGCSSGPPTGLSAELPGTAWTLERIVFADGSVERGTGERITFTPDGGLLITSCNTCNGTYRMRGNELAISESLACTRRGCAPDEIELEMLLVGDLVLTRDGSYLIVEQAGGLESPQLLFLPMSDAGSVSSSPAGR